MTPSLLTTREAAARLRIDRTTLAQWVRKGLLHVVRFNARVIRYPESELARFIERSMTK
jgi:excisionase family DNA binding protein